MRSTLPGFDGSPGGYAASLRTMLSLFGQRGWLLALAAGGGTLLLLGAVAALFQNPVFGRQIAARPEDYVFWVITAVLAGLIAGSFAVRTAQVAGGEGQTFAGGFLSFIAIGCPTCNKLAVGLLGSSGALTIFGPAQFFIGLAAVGLLVWTLLLRARSVAGACAMTAEPSTYRP